MRLSHAPLSPETGATRTHPASRFRARPPWLAVAVGLTAVLAAAGLAASAAPAHAGAQDRPASAAEGSLISATLIQRVPAASVRAELSTASAEPGGPVLGGGAVRYGVVAYDVRYRTVNAMGRPVLASGLVAFPDGGPAALPLVSYDHGTTPTKDSVPSTFGLGPDPYVEGRWSAELFASAGFAVAEPDYVGLGTGTGPIEYLVAKSEASASADMLLAARTLAARRHDVLKPGVLVTGFSAGGSAAMAFGRLLGDGAVPGFRLRVLAPVSGPFELASAQVPGIFNGQVTSFVPYLVGYAITSWNGVYHLYASPSAAFRAPFAAEMTGLFDGSHSEESIIAALPSSLGALLTPKFLGDLKGSHGAITHVLKVNSTCWTPRVPVRLYVSSGGDTIVTPANTADCAAAIRAHGGDVQVVKLGRVDHNNSAMLALPQVLRWFSSLR